MENNPQGPIPDGTGGWTNGRSYQQTEASHETKMTLPITIDDLYSILYDAYKEKDRQRFHNWAIKYSKQFLNEDKVELERVIELLRDATGYNATGYPFPAMLKRKIAEVLSKPVRA